MLISTWFFLCILLFIHSVLCSGSQQNVGVHETSSKQLQTEPETDTYAYHHPPLPEFNEQNGIRKEKSININEKTPSPRSRSRSVRRRVRPKTSTPSLEIPVQVVYETTPTPTTVRSYPSKSTISPLDRTTRIFVRRRQLQSNTNKKLDIRQATTDTNYSDNTNVTETAQILPDQEKSDVSPSIEFSKRSRESYFKRRPERPVPKVKILEEKNFVYAHSGNYHYSFLGGDGTNVSSVGSLKSYDNNKTGEAVSGSVYYKDKDGNDYSLTYTADENGYRPIGAHLPTPPPLPPAIARALKYIADKSTPSPLDENE